MCHKTDLTIIAMKCSGHCGYWQQKRCFLSSGAMNSSGCFGFRKLSGQVHPRRLCTFQKCRFSLGKGEGRGRGKKKVAEVLSWLSNNPEDMGSMPGLAQRVRDLVLP